MSHLVSLLAAILIVFGLFAGIAYYYAHGPIHLLLVTTIMVILVKILRERRSA